MEVGIYQIRNLIDGKVYIGQTQDFEDRKRKHLWMLRGNRHHNIHLQRAFNRDGRENFVVEPLLEIEGTQAEIDNIETQMINAVFIENRYNIALIGSASMTGRKHSAESRKKQSESMKGKNVGLNVGRVQSIKQCVQRSDAFTGEGNPKVKLTEINVREIRFVHLTEGKLSQREIGNLYGVSRVAIKDIKSGKNWKHVI